jgi:ABC-type lipoprotein release transport system permease subunit
VNIILRLAWRNLWRYPRRTILTTGAMAFSNVLLIFMISMQIGTYGLMIDNTLEPLTGHFQIQASGYKDDQKMRQVVPDAIELAALMRRGLQLQSISARGAAFVLASSQERSYGIQVLGVEPKFEPRVSNLPGLTKVGRYLDNPHAAEIVIGSVLARNLQITTGDELTLLGSALDGSIAAGIVTVVGIFQSGVIELDRTIAEVPIAYFQQTFEMRGAAHTIVFNVGDYSSTEQFMERAKALLPVNSSLILQDWNALQPGLKQAIQADMSSAAFMYAVLVVMVAFSVLNTQLMSVLERTREFGIVMALGLTPGRLGRLVVLETTLMGLLGLVAGTSLGGILTAITMRAGIYVPGMDQMAAQFNLPPRMYPTLSLITLLAGPMIVFLFTLLAAVYPALRLRWLHPVEAMRAA